MVLNGEVIGALQRSFHALGFEGMQTAKPQWQQLAMEVPSSTASNDYGWLQDIPGMREWIGEREIKNLSASTYNIKNKDFESTVSVKRSDLEDDNGGIYAPMFKMLGYNVMMHPDRLVFNLLLSGFTEKCYDGKSFFNVTHKIGKVNVSNTDTGKLTKTRFENALAAMQSITNAAGEPLALFMGEGDNTPILLVGPTNRVNADSIVNVARLTGGADNPNFKRARVVVSPYLIGIYADMWMLLDTSMPVRPFILQRRKAPNFVRMDQSTDDGVFMRNEFIYGYDDRKNVGFGFWQLAFGSDGSVA